MKNLIALSILLAGCSSTPPEGSSSTHPSGLLPTRGSGTPPPPVIQSLTLEEALRLADGHPELRELEAKVEAARGRAEQAGAWSNPEAILRAESVPFSSTGDGDFVAGLAQRIPLGGRLGAAERVELLEAQRIQHELASRRLQRRSRVQGAFAVALYFAEAEAAQAEIITGAESGERLAKARIDAGDGLPEELLRAQLETIKLRVERERTAGLRTAALFALAGELGLATTSIPAVTGSLSQALELPTLETVQQAIERHPDVLAGEGDVAVQRGRIELAEAQRIPDLSVELLYRRLGVGDESAFDAGIGIAIPLTDRNQGRLREARAEESAAAARSAASRVRLVSELRDAYLRLALALATTKRYREEILPKADAILAAYEKRYALGDASLAEVLPVQRDRAALKLAHLDALRDVMIEWARIAPVLSPR